MNNTKERRSLEAIDKLEDALDHLDDAVADVRGLVEDLKAEREHS